jgi:hypothetical protein
MEEFNKINPFFNYKGLLVEKTKDGYKWGNKIFKTLEELDIRIKEILDNLSKSIL